MESTIEQDLISFLIKSQRSEIEDLLEFASENRLYSFCFNLFEFLHTYPNRSELILKFEPFLDQCLNSVIQAQNQVYSLSIRPNWLVKRHLQIIFSHIPVPSSILFDNQPKVDREMIGRLLALNGKIIKMQTKKIREKVEKFKCQSCDFVLEINYNYSEIANQQKIICCPGIKTSRNNSKYAQFILNTRGSEGVRCLSKSFDRLDDQTIFIDSQELHVFLDEKNENDSSMRFVKVICEGEFGIQPHSGMSCIYYGFFTIKYNNFCFKMRNDNQLVFYAINIQTNRKSMAQVSFNYQITQSFNNDPNFELYFRNYLIDCLSHGLRGIYDIKIAVLLFMVCNTQISNNSDVLNILMIGETQTGKTHLVNKIKSIFELNYVISSSSIMDTSNLTIDVLKDGKSELIEAGLLSVVNGDMLLIDDINLLPKRSLLTIQESIREKKIINKKHGIFCDFKFGFLATCAPINSSKKLTFGNSIEHTTGLPDSIVNIFDLVFKLPNDQDYEDCLIETYIESLEVHKKNYDFSNDDHFVRKFVRDITNLSTTLDENCQELLTQYVKYLDRHPNQSRSPRILDTLVLICKCHAKLFFRRKCIHFDAVSAIMLYESAFPSGIIELSENLFYVEREEEFHEVYDNLINFLFDSGS